MSGNFCVQFVQFLCFIQGVCKLTYTVETSSGLTLQPPRRVGGSQRGVPVGDHPVLIGELRGALRGTEV